MKYDLSFRVDTQFSHGLFGHDPVELIAGGAANKSNVASGLVQRQLLQPTEVVEKTA